MDPHTLVIGIFEFVLLIFSLSVHECAHAWTASLLGDQTARLQGRITLNPVPHIDPIGTLLFPALAIFLFPGGFLFGWAKPTPVITRNFKKIVRDDNLTTLAGPASNLLIVLAAVLVLIAISFASPAGNELVLSTFAGVLSANLGTPLGAIVLLAVLAIQLNLALFFFNLLPIPPLDGSHLLRNVLPYNAVQVYDRIGGFLSWILMIALGRIVLGLLMAPSMQLIFAVLTSMHRS